MSRAMIGSVGGTPEPIIKTTELYPPEYVCFFASGQTVDMEPQKTQNKRGGLIACDHSLITAHIRTDTACMCLAVDLDPMDRGFGRKKLPRMSKKPAIERQGVTSSFLVASPIEVFVSCRVAHAANGCMIGARYNVQFPQ